MIRFKPVEVSCEYCGKKKFKKVSRLLVNPLSFCNKQCVALYNYKKIKTTCKFCKKRFDKSFNKYNNSKNHFCCKKCFSEYSKTTPIKLTCDYCSQIFERKIYNIKNLIYHFCSQDCSQNFMKTIKNKKIKPKNHKSIFKNIIIKKKNNYRNKAIKKFGYHCQNKNCKLTKKQIELDPCQYEVDHINNNRKDHRIENLQVLCCYCHAIKTRKVSDEA